MHLTKTYLFAFGLMLLGLGATLWLDLLPALLGGFLVYFAIEAGSRLLRRMGVVRFSARLILLIVIILVLLSLLGAAILGVISFISHGQESIVSLLQRMADIVGGARTYLPAAALEYLPADMEEWQSAVSTWLRGNAGYLSGLGKHAGVSLLHIIFGMIIGGLVAVSPPEKESRILAKALKERIILFGDAFRRVVFSQCKISVLNTFLTALFLGVVLPLSGNPLPFLKTMIAVTFVVGLLPVIGNLISNSVIFLIALSVSPFAAIAALVFLIVIHKLEYFFNAQIVGLHIKARAWEILLAMLVFEAAFGLTGLVAAPIYYAYLKDEMVSQKLI
jgi:predicted PurR-regulated permease PerM